MTNYSMQEGRRRNDRIRAIQKFILGLLIALSLVFGLQQLFKLWDKQQAELLNIEYCWVASGNHYVVPDERCGLVE